jgi:hypothetical protein
MDRDKMSNLYRGLSIDASYQVSVHMAKGFQRRRLKCDVNGRQMTDDECQVMAKAHVAFGRKHLWKVLYKDYSFCPDPFTNMATTGNSCF